MSATTTTVISTSAPSSTLLVTKGRVSYASLTGQNLGAVRKLNAVLFPVVYSPRFYKEVLGETLRDFCKLVYFNDVPVGTLCARIERASSSAKLYIMTLGILAPYRNMRLGTSTLTSILSSARAHTSPKITSVYCHVQVGNEGARRFYERQGFKVVGEVKEYYKRLEERAAWILELTL